MGSRATTCGGGCVVMPPALGLARAASAARGRSRLRGCQVDGGEVVRARVVVRRDGDVGERLALAAAERVERRGEAGARAGGAGAAGGHAGGEGAREGSERAATPKRHLAAGCSLGTPQRRRRRRPGAWQAEHIAGKGKASCIALQAQSAVRACAYRIAPRSHERVGWSAAALRRAPLDVLRRVLDVASLAVQAVLRVQ